MFLEKAEHKRLVELVVHRQWLFELLATVGLRQEADSPTALLIIHVAFDQSLMTYLLTELSVD